ncbi:transposable element Tcb2 transposase [Trichonephila clavipes]|nr:transposable element Tcb2 transposase [Trichonephila clavipes]
MDIAVWGALSDAEIVALDDNNTESDEDELEELTPVDMRIRRVLKQYKQLSQFETGRIIGMIEAGWSARRLARQEGRFDCVVRMCWDQCIGEMSFTRRLSSGRPRRTSRRENRNIVRNAFLQPTASLATTQGQSLTNTLRHLRLEWCRARGNWISDEWNQLAFRDEFSFNLSSGDNRVPVRRSRGARLNPAFSLQ